MSHGILTEEQWASLEPYIEDQVVYDLGAGDLELAHEMDALGARKIIAVDRHDMPPPRTKRVQTVRSHFHQWNAPESMDVAFLSWPVNWCSDAERLLPRAKIVVYVGRCTDSTLCGSLEFWGHVRHREVLAVVPNRHNVLIIYGEVGGREEGLLPEEMAGMDYEKVWTYDELYEACTPTPSTTEPETTEVNWSEQNTSETTSFLKSLSKEIT